MDAGSLHRPVMVDEVLDLLGSPAPGLIIDATVGPGGHAAAVLSSLPQCVLVGIDRDEEALSAARRRLEPWSDRLELLRADFRELPRLALENHWWPVRGIVLDLGVSSLQLDVPERGFSFRKEGPLDMRMDRQAHITAADLVNDLSEEELSGLISRYGEERHARRIARAIVAARRGRPLRTTTELAEVVSSAVPGGYHRIHPATRTFQALRIAVNQELAGLYEFAVAAGRLLAPDGRLAAITFHSLEDRLIKRAFRYLESDCVCPPRLPRCGCSKASEAEILDPPLQRPRPEEVEANPRARSARLRGLRRL